MLAAGSTTFGKAVDATTALTVAYNFYGTKAQVQGLSDLTLAYTSSSILNGVNTAEFYVFNHVSSPGFVIVSGDDQMTPILGYSTESGFLVTKINASVQYLLNNYKKQADYLILNDFAITPAIANKWANIKSGVVKSAERTTSTTVAALLHTDWDQANETDTTLTYNADCPYAADASPAAQTVTGCVATAMSQVMKFWNWPDTGVGSHSYTQSPNPDRIPMQTFNFAINYHFDSMQTPRVTIPNSYVAKLMYAAGVSVNMDYGTPDEDGSGSYVTSGMSPVENCAEYALKTYFKYPLERGYQRRHYSDANWIDTMVNEVTSGRPVIYAGSGNEGGHCWVMDGYDDDTFLHFNWGWSGYYNGYFTINNVAPPVGDTFNYDQEAIIRIMVDTATAHDTTVVSTGVNNINAVATDIQIFPNPAAQVLNISASGLMVNRMTITDIEGREVITANYTNNITNAVPVGNLPDGVYLLRLETSQGTVTRKFVIAK